MREHAHSPFPGGVALSVKGMVTTETINPFRGAPAGRAGRRWRKPSYGESSEDLLPGYGKLTPEKSVNNAQSPFSTDSIQAYRACERRSDKFTKWMAPGVSLENPSSFLP